MTRAWPGLLIVVVVLACTTPEGCALRYAQGLTIEQCIAACAPNKVIHWCSADPVWWVKPACECEGSR